MDREKFYKSLNRDEFKVVDVWKANRLPIPLFVEALEDTFGLVISYQTGDIVRFDQEDSPHMTQVVLRFVLNNQILDVERIYYDGKQLFLRLINDQSIRRVSLKVIKEVQFNGQVFVPFEQR